MREKEQLYEEAIKLKMQTNNYREENLKLKTKIKILENEVAKKEKAIEDIYSSNQFFQKSSQPQLAPALPAN